MKTEDVIFEEGDIIILNCTYHKNDIEYVSSRNIIWQKQTDDYFKDIAMFSPPGDQKPFIVRDMQSLYSNRTKLIAPNISLSAVLIIKYPICSDQGVYRCWIEYYSDSSVYTQNSVAVVNYKCNYFILIIPQQF